MAEYTDIRVLHDDAPIRAVVETLWVTSRPTGMKLSETLYLADLVSPYDTWPLTDECYVYSPKLARTIELIRTQARRDGLGFIAINSALRSRHYNNVVLPAKGYKTASRSYHTRGLAVDLSSKVRGGREGLRLCIVGLINRGVIPNGGIIDYTSDNFIHYDMRSLVGDQPIRQAK